MSHRPSRVPVMTVHAPCPLLSGTPRHRGAVPTPAPSKTYRVSTGSSSEHDQVLGVCVACDLLVRGVVEHVQSLAAEEREVDEAAGRAAAARALFRQGDSMGAMRDLARAFPVLRKGVPGVDPWDALELDAWLAPGAATDAELATAAFVLRVWNAGDPWSRPFDAMEAMARWDHVNRAVFVEWARAPWWP